MHCEKTADRIQMLFGIIGQTGPGMRQVVGFGHWSTGRGTFGARHCNQWGLYGVRVRQCCDATLFPNYFDQTGCQFSGASNLSLPLSLSKPHTMKFHLISLVFLLLTVHPVFSGHLFLLTSCRSLALTLYSVLAPSMQLHQRFGIPFLTLSVHPTHSTL